MLRFLFLPLFIFGSVSYAVDEYSFSEKHIYPVMRRGTDAHSGITFLAGAMASVLARSEDDRIREEWKDNQKMPESTAHVGDLFGTGAATLLVAGAQYAFDPNESRYESQLRGFVYGGASIYILKTAFGRKRPGGSQNYQSFPSGHTTIVFMTATHMAMAYGWTAGIISYSLAAFTAASRWADDAHWFSDTVGGAFLGYYVGRATFYDESEYSKNATNAQVKNYEVFPIISPSQYGISAVVLF